MPVNPLGETFTGPTQATISQTVTPVEAAAAVITQVTVYFGPGTYTIFYQGGRTITKTMPPAGLTAFVAFVQTSVETDQGWPAGSSVAT
jgi:hypothetical protein